MSLRGGGIIISLKGKHAPTSSFTASLFILVENWHHPLLFLPKSEWGKRDRKTRPRLVKSKHTLASSHMRQFKSNKHEHKKNATVLKSLQSTKWFQSESKWTHNEHRVNTQWTQSELKIKIEWTHNELRVNSKWTHIECTVNAGLTQNECRVNKLKTRFWSVKVVTFQWRTARCKSCLRFSRCNLSLFEPCLSAGNYFHSKQKKKLSPNSCSLKHTHTQPNYGLSDFKLHFLAQVQLRVVSLSLFSFSFI